MEKNTSIIELLETEIKNNNFTTKEELYNEINELLKKNIVDSNTLNQEKIKELLDLFDQTTSKQNSNLDLQNYSEVNLENENLIVSKEKDQILKTDSDEDSLEKEFNMYQNELTDQGQDTLANADEVFDYMKNGIKEELDLIPISDALLKDNIDINTLEKIKFFVSNTYINPYEFTVDINSCIFYNVETKEVFEIRINPNTNEYEIYNCSQKTKDEISSDDKETYDSENDEELTETSEEKISYEQAKTRKLIPSKNLDNNAFIKSNILIITACILFLIIIFIIYKCI